MSIVSASNHARWEELGLKDYVDYADKVTFCNQEEMGDGVYDGEWYYADDWDQQFGRGVIYYGSFGNYNSPGASHYTYADVYHSFDEYAAALEAWESQDEYVDDEEENDMKLYEVTVIEVRHVECVYNVLARNEDEAKEKAEHGETEAEDEVACKGVNHREVVEVEEVNR